MKMIEPETMETEQEELEVVDTPESAIEENRPSSEMGCSGTLIALRWIERRVLESDHAKLRKSASPDAWWVLSGEETTGPHEFREVVAALSDGISPIGVLHESAATEDAPSWVTLSYRPLWKDPKIAFVWKATAWVMGALVCYLAVSKVVPWAWQKGVDVIFVIAAIVFVGMRWKKNARR